MPRDCKNPGDQNDNVDAAGTPQGADARGMRTLPRICSFFSAASIAYVFMERIA
jgi:hypothetical protein